MLSSENVRGPLHACSGNLEGHTTAGQITKAACGGGGGARMGVRSPWHDFEYFCIYIILDFQMRCQMLDELNSRACCEDSEDWGHWKKPDQAQVCIYIYDVYHWQVGHIKCFPCLRLVMYVYIYINMPIYFIMYFINKDGISKLQMTPIWQDCSVKVVKPVKPPPLLKSSAKVRPESKVRPAAKPQNTKSTKKKRGKWPHICPEKGLSLTKPLYIYIDYI